MRQRNQSKGWGEKMNDQVSSTKLDPKKKKELKIVAAISFIGIAIFIYAKSSSDAPAPSITPAASSEAVVPPVAAAEIPRAPVIPSHNYSLEEDGEYGYEGAISENDKNNGVAASKVLMFRYLGEKDGTYTVQMKSGDSSQLTTCKAPCDFVKNKRYFAGQLVQSDTIRAGDDSIIHAVFEDAQNGMLKLYHAVSK